MAEDAIIYEAPENAAESVEAAWFPTALLQANHDAFYYADEATRRIIELNIQTRQKRVLFDLSPYENALFGTDTYQANWGTALIRANDAWIISAAPQTPLIWMNAQTGEIEFIGECNQTQATLPQEGVQLGDVSFELFGGIGRTDSGFYIVFGQQIFFVEWDGQSPKSLIDSRLELVAGSMSSNDSTTTNASMIALNLDRFTFFAELDGWLYFWNRPKLNAVKNGKIYTITGDGTTSSIERLEDFYAQRLPQNVPLIAHQGALWSPYWIPNIGLLKIEVDTIDEMTGTVSGAIFSYYPEVSALNYIAPFGDHLICSDQEVGNFWMIPLDKPDEAQIIQGPASLEERRNSLVSDQDSPYDPHAILGPLTIQTIQNGDGALIYSPTFMHLNYLNFNTGTRSLLMDGYIRDFTSNGRNKAWLASGRALYIMDIAEDNSINYLHAPSFFRDAPIMGVPCSRTTFRLTETPQIMATSKGMLIFAPNAHRIFNYQYNTDSLTVLHDDGWFVPNLDDAQAYYKALITRNIAQWTANDTLEAIIFKHNKRSYLGIVNLGDAPITFAGNEIKPDDIRFLSGFKDNPIEDGQNIESTSSDNIAAITLDMHHHVLVAAGSHLFSMDEDARWHAIAGPCSELPNTPDSIGTLGDNEIYTARIHGELYACSSDPYLLAGSMHQPGWSRMDAQLLTPCLGHNTYVMNRPSEICTGKLDQTEINCFAFESDPVSLACDESSVYASAQDNRIYRSYGNSGGKLTPFMGMGMGLADETTLKQATLGIDTGKLETDSLSNLYLWMRDTCTIWKVPNAVEINEKSSVYRIITDDRICNASAFAVTRDGDIAIVYDNQLWIKHYGDFEFKITVPDDVIDMTAIDNKLVLMTTRGLYVWNGRTLLLHARNPIEIDGETIDYAIPASYYHRMVQAPGEDAVLIPVFAGNRILKVAI
ncbi:MAG: hypothetical protein J6A01_11305 [Proteobacteria bacterium]|nr:hypothetical protein [Pseudomonadota bacterium]